jgi:YfiH family protein
MDATTLSPIRSEALDLPGINHAFFTREGGVSTGIYASLNGGQGSRDDPAAVQDNKRRIAAFIGVEPDHLLTVHQFHSPDIVTVTTPWAAAERPRADGMVTARPGLALGIATADCGPVLFADPQAKIIGACHSGWKGAFGGVLEATLQAMEDLGATKTRITAVLGPTISAKAYEVGPEFVERFAIADPDNARFFRASDRDGHSYFDLPAYIAARLALAGIGRFVDLALCTYADEQRFFSFRRTTHRAEADYGRLIAAITLTGE